MPEQSTTGTHRYACRRPEFCMENLVEPRLRSTVRFVDPSTVVRRARSRNRVGHIAGVSGGPPDGDAGHNAAARQVQPLDCVCRVVGHESVYLCSDLLRILLARVRPARQTRDHDGRGFSRPHGPRYGQRAFLGDVPFLCGIGLGVCAPLVCRSRGGDISGNRPRIRCCVLPPAKPLPAKRGKTWPVVQSAHEGS